jgi:hypothetical protein
MTMRHDVGALALPTRANFRGRLEAIGLGRWASLYPGARLTERIRHGGGLRP